MPEPGSLAPSANASLSRRTRSCTNRNRPPARVVNSRGARTKSWTLATAQRRALFLESPADLVDRVVPLAQRHDLLVGAAFPGLLAGTSAGNCEEFRQFPAAKGVAEHAKCARRVAEALCRLRRRQFLHEKGAQSLILALARRRRLLEEAPTVC